MTLKRDVAVFHHMRKNNLRTKYALMRSVEAFILLELSIALIAYTLDADDLMLSIVYSAPAVYLLGLLVVNKYILRLNAQRFKLLSIAMSRKAYSNNYLNEW